MNTTITAEMIGHEATEDDLQRMVQLLRLRGYETERGMFNGAVEPRDIPESVWMECIELL